MKKRWISVGITVLLAGAFTINLGINEIHTVKLSEEDRTVKNMEITPVFNLVKVYGDSDTDVLFTDVETGKTHLIGYITPGMSEKIRLERGHRYTVKGAGNITIRPANIKTEKDE